MRFPWFSLVLIFGGSVMLLDRLDFISLNWMIVIWIALLALGASKVYSGFVGSRGGTMFWGAILFLFSLYQILDDLRVIDLRGSEVFAVVLLAVGLGFVMMLVSNPKEWHLTVPAVLLIGLGVSLLLAEYGYLSRWMVASVVRNYWPLGLILFGGAMIVRRRTA